MNLSAIGCSVHTAPVELREQMAFPAERQSAALAELAARYGCEGVLLSTCNRVELYLGRDDQLPALGADLIAEFLAEERQLPTNTFRPFLYEYRNAAAVTHLFRVASSLDSLIVGEGQIAGQVKQAYDTARELGCTGPLLNQLFHHAMRTAKRVRSETGITRGHVSISSVAVDFVRQVFDRFDDKVILVIGAGKMSRLTLKHLQDLGPGQILVTNRGFDKALAVADACNGTAVPWEMLDDTLAKADIVLSTTGAPEPIITKARYEKIRQRRTGTVVILDIAVPRDFDPSIHDGDQTCLFDIDDLTRIREQTLAERREHIAPAEAIIAQEQAKFVSGWHHQRNGMVIRSLQAECEAKRQQILKRLFGKLNGKLDERDIREIEGAFRLFQNQLLHAPITALREASAEGTQHGLLETIRKLFGLQEQAS